MIKQGVHTITILSFVTLSCCQNSDVVHLTNEQVWGFGILAGIGVSLIGFIAAIILVLAKRCCNESYFKNFIKFLFSLAFGALMGDAIIHIMAEAYQNQLVDKMIVSAIFIVSLVGFILIDRAMHAFGFSHTHWIGQGQSDCQDQHKSKEKEKRKHDLHCCEGELNIEAKDNMAVVEQIKYSSKLGESITKITPVNQSEVQLQNEKKEEKSCCKSLEGKGSAGYMNILGSFIHNFIDGLALGVSFATGNPTEIVPVVVAIVAHEIPRELGDVAILLKSSFSEYQTVFCNGFVNFMSLIGVIIGLAVVNLNSAAKTYTMVCVAGNFVYIAADIWRNLFKNKGEGAVCKNLMELIGAGVGVGSMFALTLLQTSDNHSQ